MSCSSTHYSINNTIESTYKIAQNKLMKKNYTGAIQDLLNLQKLHLFHPYPQRIHLNLIYAYYKTHQLKLANNSIQSFLKSYPNYKELDYILYMHGIINMSLDKDNILFFNKNLNINWNNCNPNYANSAFFSFSKLIHTYPNSKYYIDTYKRLIILKNRIAEYELSVIKFYNARNAYISVITRSEKMLHYFPDTQATYQALYYMKKAYQNLYLFEQSHKIQKIIIENSITY